MWFLAEKGGSYNPSAMHNLKTRIKRGKHSPKKGSTEDCVDDWQFVNFNPFFYGANNSPGSNNNNNNNGAGNRRSLAYGEVLSTSEHFRAGGSPAISPSEEATKFASGGSEDFYEFPTSTKLNLKRNSQDDILSPGRVKDDVNLLKNLQRRSLQSVPCDLLPPYPDQLDSSSNIQNPQISPPTPPRPPAPLPPSLKKSNSVLSTSSSSSLSTNPSPSNSNPVSRSSSRGKEESSVGSGNTGRSTFYIPPALPPKGGRLRTSALSLLQSPPETEKKKRKGKPPPPPPVTDLDHVGDLFELQDFLDSCHSPHFSSSPPSKTKKAFPCPVPPPPPPPYPKEGLGRLIRSNNLSTNSRPLSWDLNLKAGTVTLIEEGGDLDQFENNRKSNKLSSFYNVHLHGRNKKESKTVPPVPINIKDREKVDKVPQLLLSSSPTSSSGPPLPLKPRKLHVHYQNHHYHQALPSISPTSHNNPNVNLHSYGANGVANLCLNLTTISEKPLGSSGSSLKGDRRPDTLSEERIAPDGFTLEDDERGPVNSEAKKPSTAVGRSESCKERVQRKQTRERRKHSDPNLTSKSSDVDLDNQRQLSDANNSGSSSNSSLSARYLTSQESPSTSLELVGASNNSSSSLRERSSETPETTVGHSSEPFKSSPAWDGDSDIEIDQDPPDWTKNVPEETLAALDRLEKKRQEVLNELFHTERSHVRNLKVVDRLFHRPIRTMQLLPEQVIQMLFANLEDILEMHGRLNSAFKKLRMESPLVGDIGSVLLEMFDGESGDNFKKAASTFCAKQQIGLELFKDKRRKDQRFNTFLTEAESDAVCRRLGIKDMIPMAMQRLTKYPLLFENLCNCTASDTEEYKNIQRAVELSKEILCHVNHAKKEAEDEERLLEIQKKLDKSAFDKGIDKTDPSISEIRNLDFTRHRLIHEGPLMWRMTKSRGQKTDLQEVQAVLLNDMIVILMKQDDRYVIKIHNMGFPGKSDRMMAKPIIKLNNLHHRPVATDKKAFFLISTTSSNMYELVCSTAEERNVWFHHITKAADDYKNRQESRRSENLQNSVTSNTNNIPPSPLSIDAHDDKSKDSGADHLSTGDCEGEKYGHLIPPTATPSLSKEPSPAPEDPRQSPGSPPDKSEELKRADAQVQKALEDKLRIATNLFHIPPSSSKDESNLIDSKDAKELIVTCISNVDRLIGIVSSQKFTKENSELQKEQQGIHANLNRMLTHVLSEFERKEEELELRRHELHRVREQNHGYQERLKTLTVSNSPNSRPSSLLSDHQPHDDQEVAKILPSKPLSCDLVATSNSEEALIPSSDLTLQSTDLAQNFADATPVLESEDRSEGESEKNRDCPETEVVIVTTTSASETTSDLVKESSAVPEPSTTNGEPALLVVTTNGHNGNGESTSDSDHVDEEKSKSPKKLDSTDISSSSSATENKAEETT